MTGKTVKTEREILNRSLIESTDSIRVAIDSNETDIQYPLSVDGDSVYAKDIDVTRSDTNGFDGLITDPFDDLHSENVDLSATNPKYLLVHFKRTVITNLVGIGSSEGCTFSNVKVIGILSGLFETVLADFSDDDTDRTTQFFIFPNAGLNAVRIEFHTADEVGVTNIFIPKIRILATVSETPIVYGTSYMSPYMLNGGSQAMNVNGSVTPVDFTYTVTGFAPGRWFRSFIDLQDGNNAFIAENFGLITNGLANGVDIIINKDGVETVLENWKTNMNISMTCYDFSQPYRDGAYIGRWTISRDIGNPITLFPGDEIIVRINDDLTSVDAFRFRAKLRQ